MEMCQKGLSIDDKIMKNFENEARERWSNTDAYREHEKKTKNYTKEKWAEINEGLMAIFTEFFEVRQRDLLQIRPKCKLWLSNCRNISLKTTIHALTKFSLDLVKCTPATSDSRRILTSMERKLQSLQLRRQNFTVIKNKRNEKFNDERFEEAIR